MVPQYKKIGTALITAIMLGLFLAGTGSTTSWAKNEVIEVPGGDVEALYAAVYDEDGQPRDNVEIVLEPGVFFLEEEDRPFGGRLILGDNTILRSSLDLSLNDDFVPTGEDPCPTGAEPACGAIIDGSQLPDPENAFDESYIVTGNGSRISRLTLQSDLAPGEFGDRIGIQLPPHGSDPTFAVVDRVIVRGTLLGIQIASTTGSNNLGLIRHSWLTENHFGTNAVQIAPDSSGVDEARLEVVASFNLMHDNTEENFLIMPGMGGDRNDMVVSLLDNELGYGGFASVVVQVLENFIYENKPSSDNSLSFSISGGYLSGRVTEAGELEGDGLLIRNLSRSGSDEASSNNVINGQVNGVEFVNTATDVVFDHDQGPGQDNQTVLVMRGNRHVDDLGGIGQFSVTDNPPESEFLMVGTQTSFDEQNLNFDSAGLEGHFTGTAEESAAGQAAPLDMEWLVYNRENSGLPSSLISPGLAFDAQGHLWIGTQAGLAKFDGETWTVYSTANSGLPDNRVVALAEDVQGNMWVGTNDGLAKFDGENWAVFNTDNSGLPYNAVHKLTFDPQGTLWIGLGKWYASGSAGLAKFDGETWTVYNTANSGLPDNHVINLAVDVQGDLWISTVSGGLAKFDGEEWTVYDRANSELPVNNASSLAFDVQGTLWIGTEGGGLVKFDGEEWTVYNTQNSGLPSNGVMDGLVIDGQGTKWIGTQGGLAQFDGNEWTAYNTDNSELPSNWIWSIAIDTHGNKWIGTSSGGLAVYREGGVILPGGGDASESLSFQNE
jgi:sugar lactone lactonase YvrE